MSSLTLTLLISFCFIGVAMSASITKATYKTIMDLTLKCGSDDEINNQDLDVSDIGVYFYNYEDSSKNVHRMPIKDAAQNILTKNKLDKSKKFLVFVSGFNTNVGFNEATKIRNLFMKENSYLIIIDHSSYTNKGSIYNAKYGMAVKHVKSIGKRLAQLLEDLYKGGVPAQKIHAMGHSLGGQILGHVGENFHKFTGKKIARISSLDPAGPCFYTRPAEEQIRSEVAEYVEVYHCNSGIFGTNSTLADVDFFMNDGKSQPACDEETDVFRCSHNKCVDMWKQSVLDPKAFTAYKCDNYDDFIKNKCKESTTAGFRNPLKAKGTYYFSTKGFVGLW
nr:phospholipase A1 [Helicoverpa armigera]